MQTNLILLLKYLLLGAVSVQLVYLLFVFGKMIFHRKAAKGKGKRIPVSVVICARNEEENLSKNLPGILGQDYENFEVVVVNDASSDNTTLVLSEMARRYARLKVINKPEKGDSGKKAALAMGIDKAKHEVLLLTDADCKPAGESWIRKMTGPFENSDIEIVLGYGPFRKHPGLFNKYVRFDAAYIAIQYFSFLLAGFPYMGTGRNLAYRKGLFEKQGGFDAHSHISSGDDDLFVNAVSTPRNTAMVADQSAFSYSDPKRNMRDWLRQKLRHNTTGIQYRPVSQLLLAGLHFSHFLLVGCLLPLIILTNRFHLIYGLVILRFFIQLLIFRILFRKLKENDLIYYLPFFDVIYGVFNPVIVVISQFISRKKWMN